MKPTPQSLVDAVVAEQKTRPIMERATKREILEALLQCHAEAVRERDMKRALEQVADAMRVAKDGVPPETVNRMIEQALDRVLTPTEPTPPVER